MQRKKVNFEFLFKASPTIVYKFLTAPDCLIRWFCDEVDVEYDKELDVDKFAFVWQDSQEIAYLIDDIEEERLKFRWEESDNIEEYFEFRLSKSEVTGDSIVEVTDFCDDDEVQETTQLWETQMGDLKRAMGG